MGLFSKSKAEIESAIKHQKGLIELYKKQGRNREMASAQEAVSSLEKELFAAKK